MKVAVAQKLDSAGCIAKLLCEIEGMPADQLTPSMSTFKTAFENPQVLKSSRTEYDQAIALGSKVTKDDLVACSVRFNKCLACLLGYVRFPSHPGLGPSPALAPSTRYINRALSGTASHSSSSCSGTQAASTTSMNSRMFVALLLCGLWASSESLVLLGTTAALGTVAATTVTASAAAALGVGALAVLKGVLVGKHLRRRYRRDVDSMEEDDATEIAVAQQIEEDVATEIAVAQQIEEDVATEVAVAQQMDSAGCVAKLLCEIEAMSADQLTPAMSTFKTAFENNQNLRSSRGVYDLAITFGSKFGKKDTKACSALFEKCVLSRDDLSFMLDSTFSC
ncbi:uncharacterized protein LOC122260394 [Penaeus japonicus]|uniref:uncharacterized protein LOC122260394 n=1 Tax=Penaeus japonicus TaxID=27405 RepID=UPI001C715C7B|nr:uncharacterized protein LOC122260394 [Penaeus japonicus]